MNLQKVNVAILTLSTMSLCAAVAWSSQSSTFSQDPYNIRNINSLVKGKQTKPENKWVYDKMHLKAQETFRCWQKFGSFLIRWKTPLLLTMGMCLETITEYCYQEVKGASCLSALCLTLTDVQLISWKAGTEVPDFITETVSQSVLFWDQARRPCCFGETNAHDFRRGRREAEETFSTRSQMLREE